jgi:hypothetical protein
MWNGNGNGNEGQAGGPAPSASSRELYFSTDQNGPFHHVEGGQDREVMQVDKLGATLMVEAYVVLWALLMGWIWLLWRKQAAVSARLDELERVLDKAAGARATGREPAVAASAEKAKA